MFGQMKIKTRILGILAVLAMGYLAIVIPDPGTGTRNATPACQGISGCSTTGEQDAH